MIKKYLSVITTLTFSLLVLTFNLWLVYPWFTGEGPVNLGSIEVSYVSMSQFLVKYWPNLSWAPFWYLGFPFHLFYTPVLPVLTALLKVVSGFSFWHAYRFLTGIGLVLAPVSLFLFVAYLSKNKLAALASAIFYSVVPSIFYFVLPSGEVAADRFAVSFDPRRFVILARWGEGPHIFSLVFLPLAGLFFFKALKEKGIVNFLLAASFIALTALTNAIGLYALAFLLGSIFLVKVFFDSKGRGKSVLNSILIAVFTYGLIAFWYNPSFMGTFFGESGGVLKNWTNMFPWGWLFIIGVLFLFLYVLKKLIKSQEVVAVLLWTVGLFSIVAYYYLSAPPELSNQRVELAPQALRYMVEMDMGLAAFLGLFIGFLAEKISFKNKVGGRIIGLVLAGVISVVSVGYGLSYSPVAWKAMGAQIDLEKTAEKGVADFLSGNVDSRKGERVFLAGNDAFYLDYFSDVWQLRGGLYQAKTHPWPEHIYYQLRIGTDPEIAQGWLEAVNAKYALVDSSGEIEQKEKFSSLTLKDTLKDGTFVYAVGLSNTSPVKIVNLKTMEDLVTPKKGDDKQPILAYADWLKEIKKQDASFEKINNDLYKIKANVGEEEGILVQMTADKGWRVSSAAGKPIIKKDPLGFFVLVPDKPGNFEVILTHRKTLGVWFGYLLTLITVIGAVLYLLIPRSKLQKAEKML